mgnify:CR=1 FL=1
MALASSFSFVFLLRKFCVLLGDRTLGYCEDRETLAFFVTFLDRGATFLDIIWDLRDQDDICAACDSGMECQASNLVSP